MNKLLIVNELDHLLVDIIAEVMNFVHSFGEEFGVLFGDVVIEIGIEIVFDDVREEHTTSWDFIFLHLQKFGNFGVKNFEFLGNHFGFQIGPYFGYHFLKLTYEFFMVFAEEKQIDFDIISA